MEFKLEPGIHLIQIPDTYTTYGTPIVHHRLKDAADLSTVLDALKWFLLGCSFVIDPHADLTLDSGECCGGCSCGGGEDVQV